MSTLNYRVTGLTCGHCVSAVTSEVEKLPGVIAVTVGLVPEGASTLTITSNESLDDAQLTSALDEAGDYQLVTT